VAAIVLSVAPATGDFYSLSLSAPRIGEKPVVKRLKKGKLIAIEADAPPPPDPEPPTHLDVPPLHISDPNLLTILAQFEGKAWMLKQQRYPLCPKCVNANQQAWKVLQKLGPKGKGLRIEHLMENGGSIEGSDRYGHWYAIDENGNVNENDYEMECWDAVMRPSTPGAFPKRVGESAEDGQGTPAKKHVDESITALVAELHEELDKPLEAAVSESSMVAYAAALLKKAEKVMVDPQEEDAKAIFSKLVTRLQKAEESIVASAVEESVRLAAEGKPAPRVDMRATARVLEHLRDLTKAAVEEAEEKARKLTEAEAEMGRMRQRLAEAEQKNTALKAQIAAATSAISKLTRRVVPESTVDPVQEFISEVPGLERFRTVLEAASPDKLQSVVESLLPEVLVESAPVVEDHAGPRRSMPTGNVSGTLPAKKPLSTAPVSATVKTTAAVVSRMSLREG
jgi:hypothetical protein